MPDSEKSSQRQGIRDIALERIDEALAQLSYGSIEVTVHDGRIVEIERREKRRLDVALHDDHQAGGSNT